MENKESNWLTGFGFMLAASLPALMFLQLAITASGSVNPIKWHPQFTFLVFYFAAISGMSILGYMGSNGKINLNGFYKKLEEDYFTIDEYKDKKPLDVFFSHYTNVATIGLFFCLAIYTYRTIAVENPLIKFIILGLFVFITILIVCFYALFLLRLANRLVELKSVLLYIVILVAAFFVDSKAFQLMIAGVPKPVAEATQKGSN